MQFEEEFNIEIPDDDAENLLSVGQAIDYISNDVKIDLFVNTYSCFEIIVNN